MLSTQTSSHGTIGLSGLAHGIVARVKVLALFELVLQQVLLVGEFAVEAEELLFFFVEFLYGYGWSVRYC